MTTIGVILIIIGILSFQTGITTLTDIIIAIAFIVVGVWIAGKSPSSSSGKGGTGSSDSGNSDTVRLHGDTYRGVYDENNNFIDVNDGSFTEGLDGRLRDDNGHVVERDDDGEYRLL